MLLAVVTVLAVVTEVLELVGVLFIAAKELVRVTVIDATVLVFVLVVVVFALVVVVSVLGLVLVVIFVFVNVAGLVIPAVESHPLHVRSQLPPIMSHKFSNKTVSH